LTYGTVCVCVCVSVAECVRMIVFVIHILCILIAQRAPVDYGMRHYRAPLGVAKCRCDDHHSLAVIKQVSHSIIYLTSFKTTIIISSSPYDAVRPNTAVSVFIELIAHVSLTPYIGLVYHYAPLQPYRRTRRHCRRLANDNDVSDFIAI